MDDEERRHQCEVRYLFQQAQQRGRAWVREYLDSPPVARRAERLRADLNKLAAEHRRQREALGAAARKVQKW